MSFLKKFVRNRSADNSVSQPSAPAPVVEPALPTLDRKLLLEFIDGDGELLTELTGLFNRDAPQMLEEISAGIASQNAEAVTRAAHTLKGSLLNLAAPAATEAALRLERLGRLGDLSGAEQELVSLEVEVRKVVAELASLSGGGIS